MNRMLSTHIKNLKTPICINCVNFIAPNNNYPWDDIPDEEYGKCSKFGLRGLVTGKLHYDYAFINRKDKTKCGEEGIFFEEIKINK